MTQPEPFTFTGTLIEGPDINLVAVSGLTLTDDEEERLWGGDMDARGFVRALEEQGLVDKFTIEEIDDGPAHSDSYYEYCCTDKAAFVAGLRELILKELRR